jgi:NADH:ubiquinone oxidoreductase subunit F (NADH-binding)/(2Fe-2S) ferredoxin/Pyruvate/2-oxoacid:ferredoxin oxidoreductase delta subunit
MTRLNTVSDLTSLRERLAAKRGPTARWVAVCSGSGCRAAKSETCAEAMAAELAKHGLTGDVELRRTGCYGYCEQGPIIAVQPDDVTYVRVKAADVAEIVASTVVKHEVVERLLFKDEQGNRIARLAEIPFYQNQKRVLLDANTRIDQTKIEDYIAEGGYTALVKALFHMQPDEIVGEIKRANLRGRGGGGFPAGAKWETTRKAKGDIKYVIVNGDEGDPGAFMDGSLMEGNPHSVLEGLIIGAFAIGATEGFIYVRAEYPLAVKNLLIALDQCREYGLLGTNILGSGFDFDVTLHKGAGAFVSGESSALMTAIEGRVGQPRPKYVHTSVKGIFERPSNLNNVETWATVPLIVNRGVDWFRSMGTENSKGTKIFSLVGKVVNTGLVEVPMGISLRDIVYKIGGGIRGGKQFKAVQTGGPSGGFLPESLLDLPVDFDELWNNGSMMGSGGMIVLDEDICMVDTARFYIDFLAHEGCGVCVPCREGLRNALEILNRIVSGTGQDGDIELLEELSFILENASRCALGTSAAFPLKAALKHFRSEFEAHIHEKCCPARVCTALIRYEIDQQKCVGCPLCAKSCPTKAITGTPKKPYSIEQSLCIKCGACQTVCPHKVQAVVKVPAIPQPAVVS